MFEALTLVRPLPPPPVLTLTGLTGFSQEISED